MKIFYDVDTQNDFMNKDGALYVPEAELIKPNLKKLTDYARQKKIPVLGSVDKHFGTPEYKEREGELARWGGPFPDHCMERKKGQLRIWQTILEHASGKLRNDSSNDHDMGIYIPHGQYVNAPKEPIPEEVKKNWKENKAFYEHIDVNLKQLWSDYRNDIDSEFYLEWAQEETNAVLKQIKKPWGIYLEKQSYDVFTNPTAEKLLKRLDVKEAVVYGVATDYCVKAAVMGMQNLGIQCYVVEDAIKGVFPESTKTAIEEMKEAGAKFVDTKKVLEDLI